MKCYYRCLLVRRSLWPVPGLRVGVRGAGVLTLSDCQDIARSPRGSRGQGLRHISSALLGWPVSQFRGKSKKAGQVSPGADNGDTITIRQRRGRTRQDVTGGNEAFKTGLEIWDYLEILSQMRNTPRKQGRAWHETPPPGPEPKYQRTSEMCFDKAA